MTNETPTKTTLSEAQRARVEAIRVAREVLQQGKTASLVSNSSGTLPEYRTVNDLVDIGRWIETGTHPLDDVQAEAPAES